MLPALLLLLAASQETRPQPASAPTPRDPAIDDLVERARRFQFPAGPEVTVRSFEIRFDFFVRGEEGTHEFRATHEWREPDRVRTTLDDELTDVSTRSGYDGRRYWQQEGGKPPVLLEGREFRRDREEIDERIRLSADLAGAFSVPSLLGRVRKLRRAPDENRNGRRAAVLEGETDAFGPLREAGEGPVSLRLLFDAETGALLEAVTTPLSGEASGPAAERFLFEAPKAVSGVMIPHRIRVFEGGATSPRFEITIRGIRLNPGIEDGAFHPPR